MSGNGGLSGSDTGAAGSGESDFVVAGPSVPEAKEGGSCEPSALATDFPQEATRQAESEGVSSPCNYSPSLKPWDALSVSSFDHTSCARTEHVPSVPGDPASCSLPSDESGEAGILRRLAFASDSSAGVNLSLAFGDALGRVSDGGVSELIMPWETPLMKAIFSDDPGASFGLSSKLPVMVGSVPALPVVQQQTQLMRPRREAREVEISLAAQVLQPLRDEDVIQKQQRMIEQGVAKWRLVFGRYARHFSITAPDEDSILASLGTRSPHTILKRANAVLAFLRWFDVFVDAGTSAFCEEAFWKYVKFLKKSDSAASCGTSFLSGIRFAKYVVGMEEIEDPSRRCAGGCEQLASEAAIVKQAEALEVRQLMMFHDLLHREEADAWDKAFGAYCLVCAYGRCRQSDMSWVDRVDWEVTEGEAECGREGYIVVYTRHHKTARATAKKSLLLPIIIPAASVDSRPWLPVARQAFESVGLRLCGCIQGPLFRPLGLDGANLCKRGVCTGEVSAFIRLVLGISPEAGTEGPRVSSHSLKRTCLAFASKAGLSKFSRACLGRHVLATESSEALYSVDLGLPAVQELEELLAYIRDGIFVPDAARAFRWNWAFPPEPPEDWCQMNPVPEPVLLDPEPVCNKVKDETEVNLLSPEGDGQVLEVDGRASPAPTEPALTSSSSGSSSDSSSESEGPACKRHRVVGAAVPIAGSSWVMHRKSRILHRVFRENMLLCGRPLTAAYEEAPGAEDRSNPVCKSCHKHLADEQE